MCDCGEGPVALVRGPTLRLRPSSSMPCVSASLIQWSSSVVFPSWGDWFKHGCREAIQAGKCCDRGGMRRLRPLTVKKVFCSRLTAFIEDRFADRARCKFIWLNSVIPLRC